MALMINIHSHQAGGKDEVTIHNIHQGFTNPLPKGYFSAGIHPCHIDQLHPDQQLEELSALVGNPSVIAIGECGIDRLSGSDPVLQKNIFSEQIKLAIHFSKPLIIHCVKAFDELKATLKENKCSVPVIYHGFAKSSPQLANDLLNDGAYLSFGASLFHESMAEVFRYIPDNRFFLETDDHSITIESIYQQACKLKKYEIEYLSDLLIINFNKVFNSIFI
jgi:TatD DNase family protein